MLPRVSLSADEYTIYMIQYNIMQYFFGDTLS